MDSDYDESPYTQTGDRVARLAVSGIRLVIGDFRTDVTKTLQSGVRGKLRIDYGDPREPQEPIKWMWRFIDGAKSAGELYGRALVVICAEQYASRLVVPTSQRTHPASWGSHKDRARKALTKLASPHLPTSLKQLEKAIAQTHADHDQAISATRDQAAPPAVDLTPDDQANGEIDDETLDDPDEDYGDPDQQPGE